MKYIFSISELKNSACASKNQHLFEKEKPKRSKYNNVKTEVDGIEFDSRKEAKRFKELKILLKAGEIGFLARQVVFDLSQGGIQTITYKADFVYTDSRTGLTVVEDCKGFATKEFKKKARLMKKIHGIEVKLT
jgi:hypothetical protein